jgi:hypothetical protein
MSASNTQSGNVLFLILIAVALFAALSYAVTQSTRGGGNANDETSKIDAALISQYSTSLNLAVMRMNITGGVSNLELEFNPPSELGSCTSGGRNCIFHPSGGGATYQAAPANLVTGSTSVDWIYNTNNDVSGIGSDGGTSATAETVAILPGVTDSVCQKINEEVGLGSTIPGEDNSVDLTTQQKNGYSFSSSGDPIDADLSGSVLSGYSSGCFDSNGINYYYHTLSEN